jgi:hypothetical protein
LFSTPFLLERPGTLVKRDVMSTRQFCASAVAAALVLLAGTSTASAQTYVTWTQTYPQASVNSVFPNLPWIAYKGNAAAVTNYKIGRVQAVYVPAGGGSQNRVDMDWDQLGNLGQKDVFGAIQAKRVTVSAGQYSVWIDVRYDPLPGTGGQQFWSQTSIINNVNPN